MMLSVAKESLGERKRTRIEGRVGATMLCRDWRCSELIRPAVSLSRTEPIRETFAWLAILPAKKVVDEASLNLWREAGSVCFAETKFLPAGQLHLLQCPHAVRSIPFTSDHKGSLPKYI